MSVTPIATKFEDVEIIGRNLSVQKFTVIDATIYSHKTPFTGIWKQMIETPTLKAKLLNGKILIIFRNQRENSYFSLSLEGDFLLSSETDRESASIFCKAIQYLFEWASIYITENNIVDEKGLYFVMPSFLYSKGYFEYSFQ